jgi:hypothetical protein
MDPSSTPREPRKERKLGVAGVLIAGAFAAAIVAGGIGTFVAGRDIKSATDGKPLAKGSVVAATPFSLAPAARSALAPTTSGAPDASAPDGGATPLPNTR